MLYTTTIETIIACLEVIDCGAPIVGDGGVVIRPYNNTKFNAMITFQCDTKDIPTVIMAVCGSNGEWVPSPSSFVCQNGTLGTLLIVLDFKFSSLYLSFSVPVWTSQCSS